MLFKNYIFINHNTVTVLQNNIFWNIYCVFGAVFHIALIVKYESVKIWRIEKIAVTRIWRHKTYLNKAFP